MPGHLAYLERHYQDGTFLASGRKVPRTGGVILARGTQETLEPIVATDPFVAHEMTRCVVTVFVPSMTGELLSPLRVEPVREGMPGPHL